MELKVRPDPQAAPRESNAPAANLRGVLWSKPVRAVLTLLALAAVAELSPRLERLRVLTPRPSEHHEAFPAVPPASTAVGEAELDRATENRPDLAQPEKLEAPVRAASPIAQGAAEPTALPPADVSPLPIVDEAHSLDKLFAVLSRAERHEPSAIARIAFFGDSVVASDFGTGTLRRLLDARFGDAGHGFVLVANAWPQYFHNDVYRAADKGFHVSRIVGPRAADSLYGLGGVSFTAAPGLKTRIGTAKSGEYGQRVSRFSIAYLAVPGGGSIEARVDGTPARVIDTNDATKHAGFAEIRVPDGPHELELVIRSAPVRLFGVVLERDVPGVVLDAIGVVGARIRTLAENDATHFAEALAWRSPDLLVFQFGANESGDGFAYPMPEYHRTMKELIEAMERAVPAAGCLVVGAMDRARKENDHLVTVPIIPHIVDEQRKVAAELGCAFYPTFEAMGGKGSMATWVRKGYGAGDYTHPTSWGADKLGKWLYSAMMKSYDEYKSRSPAP
ncbi:MAG TPA: GDSL-type esterase/lipase family protein [Polyangiaceae bacterium]|nr:GDSL-type esterase/lipase family protein [Polyangiaceae bacterium]